MIPSENPDAGRSRPEYSVPPVLRAIALLRHIGEGNRCRNSSRTAKALGINRTTLIRLLATLEAERLIERLPEEGGFRLGTGLIALAAEALNERGIVQMARPVLRRLVDELRLSAHLGVRDGAEIVYLARETPVSHLASTVHEGTRLPAHATTIGRVLLAQIDLEELRALYRERPLEAFTEKTRTTLAALSEQLDEDRVSGLAWSVANFEPDIGSAAAPVFDHLGRAVGGINVTGPANHFAPQTGLRDKIGTALRAAAHELSEGLGYRAPA